MTGISKFYSAYVTCTGLQLGSTSLCSGCYAQVHGHVFLKVCTIQKASSSGLCLHLGHKSQDNLFLVLFTLWSDGASLYGYLQIALTMQRLVFATGKKELNDNRFHIGGSALDLRAVTQNKGEENLDKVLSFFLFSHFILILFCFFPLCVHE